MLGRTLQATPELSDKWTRATAWRTKAAKEVSSNKKDHTCYTQCWKHDRKKWRSRSSHGKEEPASAMSTKRPNGEGVRRERDWWWVQAVLPRGGWHEEWSGDCAMRIIKR